MSAKSPKKYTYFYRVIAVLFSFFFFSCGITEYYYLEPPLEGYFATGLTEGDGTYNQFDFIIPNINDTGLLIGYVIYYEIYNSVTAVQNSQARIKNANILYSSQGMNTLKTMGYQPMWFMLNAGGLTDRILRGAVNTPQTIKIRLTNQGTWVTELTVDGTKIGVPLRSGGSFTFDLLKTDGNLSDNFKPESDLDTTYSTGAGTEIWYVNAYAAAFGQTSQFSPVYSQLLHLGVVRIVKPVTTP